MNFASFLGRILHRTKRDTVPGDMAQAPREDTFVPMPKDPARPKHRASGIKAHRVCYFWPLWRQFRYRCQEHMDIDRWAHDCVYYASEEGHPFQERARAALTWLQANPKLRQSRIHA